MPLFYEFNKTENEIFNETIRLITHGFSYARYQPLVYYEGKRTEQQLQSQRNLAKFMKILLVKRLESSFTAFLSTLGRFIHTYERVIAEFFRYEKKHAMRTAPEIRKLLVIQECGWYIRVVRSNLQVGAEASVKNPYVALRVERDTRSRIEIAVLHDLILGTQVRKNIFCELSR